MPLNFEEEKAWDLHKSIYCKCNLKANIKTRRGSPVDNNPPLTNFRAK